jgi:hypothetical protein
MDVAREAFVRHVALEKWREFSDLRETLQADALTAAREASEFPDRAQYGPFWTRQWETHVLPVAGGQPGPLFAAIEAAVAAALADEERERAARGDGSLYDDVGFRTFLDNAFARLYREAAGQLETPPP